MRNGAVVAVCACASAQQPMIANRVGPKSLAVAADHVGPIEASTRADLATLRAVLSAYRVVAGPDGFDVFDGEEKVLEVRAADDGGVANVLATSPKIVAVDRGWRVGAAVHDTKVFTDCMCTGGEAGPSIMCWKAGEHVAVEFDHDCHDVIGGDREAIEEMTTGIRYLHVEVLDGERVKSLFWNAKPNESLDDRR